MADTQYCYTSQRKGLSPIVSDGLHVFVCDIQKHILTTECTVYDVSQCNNKRVFTKTGNLFWIACDKNQVLLKVGYSGGILDKLVRKIGVYLYTSDYGVEHKADYTIDYSIPKAKNKEVELVCAGLIEISTESDALGCDQFTIKTCGNGDCLYSGAKKGSLFVFDTFALWEDNEGSILLLNYIDN